MVIRASTDVVSDLPAKPRFFLPSEKRSSWVDFVREIYVPGGIEFSTTDRASESHAASWTCAQQWVDRATPLWPVVQRLSVFDFGLSLEAFLGML